MVDNDGDVFVPLLVWGLVYADIHQIVERLMVYGQFLFYAGNDWSDSIPTDSQVLGDGFARQMKREPYGGILKVPCEFWMPTRPRELLDDYAVLGAAYSWDSASTYTFIPLPKSGTRHLRIPFPQSYRGDFCPQTLHRHISLLCGRALMISWESRLHSSISTFSTTIFLTPRIIFDKLETVTELHSCPWSIRNFKYITWSNVTFLFIQFLPTGSRDESNSIEFFRQLFHHKV